MGGNRVLGDHTLERCFRACGATNVPCVSMSWRATPWSADAPSLPERSQKIKAKTESDLHPFLCQWR